MELEKKYKDIIDEYVQVLKENPSLSTEISIGVGGENKETCFLTITKDNVNIKHKIIKEKYEDVEKLMKIINFKK